MRRLLSTSLCVLSLSLIAPFTASANDNENLCPVYGKFGGATADFMLPLKVQDLVDMISGKNDDLAQSLGLSIIGTMSANEIAAFTTLPNSEAELLGGAAGMVAIELLMSGQATSGADVRRAMERSCNQVGIRAILANQKLSDDATQANMGK